MNTRPRTIGRLLSALNALKENGISEDTPMLIPADGERYCLRIGSSKRVLLSNLDYRSGHRHCGFVAKRGTEAMLFIAADDGEPFMTLGDVISSLEQAQADGMPDDTVACYRYWNPLLWLAVLPIDVMRVPIVKGDLDSSVSRCEIAFKARDHYKYDFRRGHEVYCLF